VLIVSSLGAWGLITASFIRSYLLPLPKVQTSQLRPLSILFFRNRKRIYLGFIFLVLCVGLLNLEYGIYQRGLVTKTSSSLLKAAVTWLLLFGFASITSFFLHLE